MQKQFDLVLTDQNMPNMDGLTLIRSLRALPAYARVPILMLTTESSDEMKSKGRAAGATGWLVKPFDPQPADRSGQQGPGLMPHVPIPPAAQSMRSPA